MSVTVGLDYGTTNSCISCFKNGECEAVAMSDGNRLLPSAVSYADQNPVLGGVVRNYIRQGRTSVARYSKRVMGKSFDSPEVEELKAHGCPLIDVNHKPVYAFENGTRKTPEEVGAEIMKFLLKAVERFTCKQIGNVCITIPAQFDNNQRTATLNAAKMAGIPEDHIRIISEPSAAAVYYLQSNPRENCRLLIFDFRGGTFDVSIIRVQNKKITVEANRGNNHLGGIDIDYAILKWMKAEYKTLTEKELPERDKNGTKKPLLKLLAIAEKAKIELSEEQAVDIEFDGIPGVDPEFTLLFTRNRLEILIKPFVDKAMGVIETALSACNLEKGDIDDVVLVGRSTRIPLLRDTILKYFGLPPKMNLNVDTVVAEGACASFEYGGEICDRTSHSLGQLVGSTRVQCIIPIDSPLPVSYTVETRVRTNLGYAVTYVYQGKATQRKEESPIEECVSLGPFYYDVSDFADEETILVETTFTIKESGIVFVTVREKEEGVILLRDKMIQYECSVCFHSLLVLQPTMITDVFE